MESSTPRRGFQLALIKMSGAGGPAKPCDATSVRAGRNGHKLGYVPRMQNHAAAQLLDRSVPLTARIEVLTASRDPWDRVQVAVLMDA